MEEFVATQIKYGLKYMPANIVKSYFLPKSSAETRALRARGFLRGVCHPNEDYTLLRQAHIQWVRFDIPFPFAAQGGESQEYRAFKERCRGYAERGFSVMAVTPFPNAFCSNGIDPRTQEGEARVREVAAFERVAREFEEVTLIVASLRLDCVVGELANVSREGAKRLIASGDVLLDHREATDADGRLAEGAVLSIRGVGKFRIGEVTGVTRKDRLRLTAMKYV